MATKAVKDFAGLVVPILIAIERGLCLTFCIDPPSRDT